MPKRKRMTGYEQLSTLLRGIGQRAAGDSSVDLRKAKEKEDQFQDDALEFIPHGLIQEMGRTPGRHLSEHEEILLQDLRDVFDAGVLNQLSQRQRECFTDVIISGDTYTEVASKYQISKSSVQGYVKRAAKHIKDFIRFQYGF